MSKGRVKLPPLVLDGEAKVLHRMTLRELHVCLTRALRVAGGDSLEESGRSVFSIMQQPEWWPQEFPFDAKFAQKIPPEQRAACYRHLLTACYSHYKQDDVLHLFDSRPGEPPRWRLVQEGDNYTIFNRFTDKPIWTYSTNFQILPLITLSAKQNEQYRATLGEQLKKSKSDLVIRTRSQKANAPSRQRQYSDEERGESDDEAGREYPMSPRSRQLLSPDGSPRRFSIMNRFPGNQRLSIPEMYGADQSTDTDQPSNLRCQKCNTKFGNRFDLLKHLIKFQDQPTCDQSISTSVSAKETSIEKDLALCNSLKLVPRQVFDDYKVAIDNYVPRPTRSTQRVWKPQFIGCQVPLSSELGRRLFRPAHGGEMEKNQFDADFLPYEKYCQTRPPEPEPEPEEEKLKEEGKEEQEESKEKPEEPVEAGQKPSSAITSLAMDGKAPTSNNGKKNAKKQPQNGFAKFYPVDYRPRRLIYHMHTYKFTMAERRLYARMQENGGLTFEARALLKSLEPVQVLVKPLTEEEMDEYGVSLEESDEEDDETESEDSDDDMVGPPGPKCSKKRVKKPRRHVLRASMVTRSQNQRAFPAARAIAMVRKKYWRNNSHMRKRIGGTVLTSLTLKRRPAKKGKQRRSTRGLVPRRRFSLVEEFAAGQSKQQEKPGSSSVPTTPSKAVKGGRVVAGKEKRSQTIGQCSPRTRGRPHREHRLPARYRSPSSDEEAARRKKRKLLQPPAPAAPGPSPAKLPSQTSQKPSPVKISPTKDAAADFQVASLVAKILRKQIPELSPTSQPSASTIGARKAIRPLSLILPKDTIKSTPESYAPPPYALQTSEHVYANLGGHYNLNSGPPSADGSTGQQRSGGRFMTPRPLSPSTEERIRETVDEVVEAACYEPPIGQSYPREIDGLRYYEGISLDDEEKDVKPGRETLSRCSSESTIVDAIFEVPSSSDDENEDGRRRSRSESPPSRFPAEVPMDPDAPAAKRLKMTFTEICAVPQQVWPRPSKLSGRKPAILGGRTAKAVAAPSGGQVAQQAKGPENGVEDPKKTETENAEPKSQDQPAPAPHGEAPQAQKAPVVIIPTTSSGPPKTVATGGQRVSLAGRTVRVPPGCRLVKLAPKNVMTPHGLVPETSISSTGAQTVTGSIQVPIGMLGALKQPIQPRPAASAPFTMMLPPVVVPSQQRMPPGPPLHKPPMVRYSSPIARALSYSSPIPTPGTSSSAGPGPSTTGQKDEETPSLVHFKCSICEVKLSFPAVRAFHNIDYHMSMHKNSKYQLRKLVRKHPVPSVHVEAVRVGRYK